MALGLGPLLGRGRSSGQEAARETLDLTKPILKTGILDLAMGLVTDAAEFAGGKIVGALDKAGEGLQVGLAMAGDTVKTSLGSISRSSSAEVSEVGEKLGRSADVHMGRIATLDPYHNDVVVPAAAQSQGVQTVKSASISF